jgi:hypothetical protein
VYQLVLPLPIVDDQDDRIILIIITCVVVTSTPSWPGRGDDQGFGTLGLERERGGDLSSSSSHTHPLSADDRHHLQTHPDRSEIKDPQSYSSVSIAPIRHGSDRGRQLATSKTHSGRNWEERLPNDISIVMTIDQRRLSTISAFSVIPRRFSTSIPRYDDDIDLELRADLLRPGLQPNSANSHALSDDSSTTLLNGDHEYDYNDRRSLDSTAPLQGVRRVEAIQAVWTKKSRYVLFIG